ncbi:MAG TPA: tetratricopeptide repeat protein [Candidatus Sulfotelmatobacter sp.]|nr:tetratricopeptide repeat protein [Candidatus Sulfotelmatobacter sp.]
MLFVTVFSENFKTRLDRQSIVKLTNEGTHAVTWQTTTDESEAQFGDLPFGKYEVEVSAIGYLTEHKNLEAVSSVTPYRLEIILQKDPAAVNLNMFDGPMPPKARRETKHGVSALKSGKWDEANRRLDAAYKLAPENPDVNFLLGYLYYQKKDFARATDFLGNASTLSRNNVQALTLLGRVSLQQEDYGRAVSNLEKAVLADSDYWVAHDLLAASYLKQEKFDKARDEAQLAVSKGKGVATASQLVLGQALINLGQRQEGIQTLKDFMAAAPKNPSVPQVKALIARLEAAPLPAASTAGVSLPAEAVAGIDPLIAAAEPTFSVRPWQPAAIDRNKPPVAANVSCPADIVQMTGKRVEEFVDDVSRIAAIEHLLHEQLDEMGDAITKETRTFNYVASFTESKQGSIAVDEYRQEHLGLADFPDQISSSGFATLALVFHPKMRDGFEMVCEGLGELRGQATWLVHFKQREDRPAQMHDYRVGGELYSLKLKGRAWITADKFQIVRIESELVNPVPQIRLAGEHQVVEYGPVPFTKKKVQLWLPQSAEIYLDFRRHRYFRKHSFDHYMLFAVDADEKRKEPATQPADGKPQPN